MKSQLYAAFHSAGHRPQQPRRNPTSILTAALTALLVTILLGLTAGEAQASTTTTASLTDTTHLILSGKWLRDGDGLLGGLHNYKVVGYNSTLDVAFTLDSSASPTTVTLALYTFAANNIQVSVDGGAFAATTDLTSTGAVTTCTVASGLTVGAHTLTIRTVNLNIYLMETGTLTFTGAVPTLTVPAGFGTPVVIAANSGFMAGEGDVSHNATLQGYSIEQTNHVLGNIRFRAKGDTLKIWTACYGSALLLRTDGVDAASSVILPSDGIWRYVTIATGLDTSAYHIYEVRDVTIAVGGRSAYYYALMMVGAGAAVDISTAFVTKKFIAGYGDSITENAFGGNTTPATNASITHIAKLTLKAGDAYVGATDGTGGAKVTSALSATSATNRIVNMTPKPDYLVVLAGTNDVGVTSIGDASTAGTFAGDFKTMLQAFVTGLPSCKIIVVGILPRTDKTPSQLLTYNNAIQAAIAAVGSSRLIYADSSAWGLMQNNGAGSNYTDPSANFQSDGLHPVTSAYQIMADRLYGLIGAPVFRRAPGTARAGSRSSQ